MTSSGERGDDQSAGIDVRKIGPVYPDVSEQELQAFNEFALKQITTCGADSVEELASAWREARELAEGNYPRKK